MSIARVRLLLLLFTAGAICSPASAQTLSPDIVPDQYELHFAFHLHDDSFTGTEQILVTLAKPATRITLNAVGLSFTQVTVVSGWSSQPATVSVDERHQTVTFTVRRRLAAGPARIRIEYTGRLQTTPRGLYVGRANGRKYVASQFEATDARRAFACFDQPDMKASFLVTAVVPSGDVAISNGRVLSDTPGPGADEHTVKFSTTRKMSSYLAALAVGDFQCLQAQSEGVPIRVCAIGDRKAMGQFALDAAQAFLTFFDGYFSVKYPFGKLDLVAIPQFNGGGMENVGAIFFGERDLLVDGGSASVQRQKTVATTIAHEMAHEWLGDLVTMKWWGDLWLKEGFATFLETRPLQAWKPEWHAELDEVASAEQAMAADEVASAHAARLNVSTPFEIEQAYDTIVYQKAGAVLRMAEGAMGRQPFRTGVGAFIRKFAYANATAEDFWATLAEHDLHSIDQVLRSFLEQPGVPVVSAEARCITSATSALSLAQQRFWIDPKTGTPSNAVWAIPVSTRPIGPAPGVPALATARLLAERQQAFDFAGCDSLFLANAEASGYFRSAYAPETLARIAKEAQARLTPVERLRLLDDQWALARAGRLDIGQYLSMVETYAAEPRAQIAERMGDTLRTIDATLTSGATREAFRGWVRRVLGPPAGGLSPQAGGTDADASQRHVQADILDVLGTVGDDPDVLARARAAVLDDEAKDQAGKADPALLDVLTRLAAAGGDAAVFDRLRTNIEHPSSSAVHERSVAALASFRDEVLIDRALGYALSADQVRPDEAADVVGGALENPAARSVAWSFLKSHWNALIAKSNVERVGERAIAAVATFCDTAMRDDAKRFFDSRGLGGNPAVRQSLEQIQACVDFRAAQQDSFARWIAAR